MRNIGNRLDRLEKESKKGDELIMLDWLGEEPVTITRGQLHKLLDEVSNKSAGLPRPDEIFD